MIKGRFSIAALLMHMLLIIVSAAAYWQMYPLFASGEISDSDVTFYIVLPLYIVFTLFALISPLVSIKNVIIDDTAIIYKYLLMRKSYSLKDINGYFTMDLPSRDSVYETIYPVISGRILPPVSSFYISNYDELKNAIPLKSLGKVKFSWKNYMTVLIYKKYNELNR